MKSVIRTSLLCELITNTPYRVKVFRVAAVFLEELAEVKYEVVYGAGGGINIVPPYNL